MATAKVKLDGQLVKHLTVARAMDIDPETLRDWVAKGVFPEPHATVEVTWLYDKAMVDHFLATGKWPDGARFRKGQGRGGRA